MNTAVMLRIVISPGCNVYVLNKSKTSSDDFNQSGLNRQTASYHAASKFQQKLYSRFLTLDAVPVRV